MISDRALQRAVLHFAKSPVGNMGHFPQYLESTSEKEYDSSLLSQEIS